MCQIVVWFILPTAHFMYIISYFLYITSFSCTYRAHNNDYTELCVCSVVTSVLMML